MNGNIQDGFEERYFRKLWELVPAFYRTEDDDPRTGTGSLRSLIHLIARQAAMQNRSIDRLWEDQFIETCDDWVIPYIGDLVATNLVIEGATQAWRRDVANTIFYRRRKGTVPVLEQIAYDITDWHAKVVEFLQRLARNRHLLDPKPQGLEGQISGTGIGGYADLRSVAGAENIGTAFDEYHYTVDVRRGRGVHGWYNLPKIGVFLWRLRAYPIETSIAFEVDAGQFMFDPTGREIPLFAAGELPNAEEWVSVGEAQVPGPIRCRLLHRHLSELVPTSLAIYENGEPEAVPSEQLQAADLEDWNVTTTDTEIRFLIDPERGRLMYLGDMADLGEVRVSYHYGFSADIGSGPYERRLELVQEPTETVSGGGNGLDGPLSDAEGAEDYAIQIQDNEIYTPTPGVESIVDLTLQAANQTRPILSLEEDWILTPEADMAARLTLDGLFLTGGFPLVLEEGDYEEVVIRHCTLDPGGAGTGVPDFEMNALGDPLGDTRLIVRGHIQRLVIKSSILGGIVTEEDGAIEKLEMCDSIVQSVSEGDAAVYLNHGEALLESCTILGDAYFHRLFASEVIFYGATNVDDRQTGCVRFSAWLQTDSSINPHWSPLPSPYESVSFEQGVPIFVTTRFGDPHYAALRQSAPQAIREGASNGSEMGAFASLKNPIKERALFTKYEEYMPFGLVPVLIYVT